MNVTAYTAPPPAPLQYLHADPALLVVNKPSGLLSVPGRGADKADCLAARVQADYPEALIVHRLDMETSGLMVLARNADMHRRLSGMFQERRVEKHYVAVVEGEVLAPGGEIDLPLMPDWPNRPLQKVDRAMGKPSLTRYRVLAHDGANNTTRVQLEPLTGRTHQLRVHLTSLGHPILGDRLYAPRETQGKAERLLLHAQFLAFSHPETGVPLAISCPAPF